MCKLKKEEKYGWTAVSKDEGDITRGQGVAVGLIVKSLQPMVRNLGLA